MDEELVTACYRFVNVLFDVHGHINHAERNINISRSISGQYKLLIIMKRLKLKSKKQSVDKKNKSVKYSMLGNSSPNYC